MDISIKSLEINFNNWRLYLILGIIFLLTGIWGFLENWNKSITFYVFLSIAILVSGCLKIIFSLVDRKDIDNWKGSLINGIIVLFLGILLVNLSLSINMIAIIVGVLLLRYAYNATTNIFRMKNNVRIWRWYSSISIVGGIFAFLIIIYPLFTLLSRVFYASISFLLLGIFNIIFSLLYKNSQAAYR